MAAVARKKWHLCLLIDHHHHLVKIHLWLLFIKQLIGIQELSDVLELLKKCGFFETRWFDLGLALGLSKTTLDTIRANHPQDTHQCLIECLSKWLKRADAVDSKGGATWDSLSTGLRSINENAVPDMLNQEILRELVAFYQFEYNYVF